MFLKAQTITPDAHIRLCEHCYTGKHKKKKMLVWLEIKLAHPAGSTGAADLTDFFDGIVPPLGSYSSTGSSWLLSIFNGFSLRFLLIVNPSPLVTNKEVYPLNMLVIYSTVKDWSDAQVDGWNIASANLPTVPKSLLAFNQI